DLPVDHLHRLFEILPEERGAQDRVTVDHVLPGALEGRKVEPARQPQTLLQHVDTRTGRIQAMEKHRLLNRRQLVNQLDVVALHGGLSPAEPLLTLPCASLPTHIT